MNRDLADLAEVATAAARLAGEHAKVARAGEVTVDTKSSANDFVTQVDQQCEQLIVDYLSTHRPDDGIQGEEGTSTESRSGLVWHIDPIDGTSNFVYDIPGWVVSVACEDTELPGDDPFNRMVVGVVFDPNHDELFVATAGGGAKRNGETISPRAGSSLEAAIVGTGFSYSPTTRLIQAKQISEILPSVGNIRRVGSAALDLCWVACGRLDGYYEAGLKIWDRAAGALIATEAGAVVDDLNGGPPSNELTVAMSRSIEPELRRLLTRAIIDAK